LEEGIAQGEQATMKRDGILSPLIPEHKDWLVTMWHFGVDASVEYTGEKFSLFFLVFEVSLWC
jgi:hypothetical protein